METSSGWGWGTLIHRVDTVAREHAGAVALINGEEESQVAQLQSRIYHIARCLKQSLYRQGVDLEMDSPGGITLRRQ